MTSTPSPGPLPRIPDIDLIRPVGRGGFGEVWIGTNRATGALRAVKLIPLHGIAADPAGREIVSLGQLEAQRGTRHPNLLDIQHVGKTDEYLFYLMDPADDVSGRSATADPEYRPATLARRLELGPLPAEECLRHARQLLAGLAHLHDAGMVHRDVKPANCLFVGRELKLADFGLLTTATSHLSRLGTLKYMPPDGRMDLRADVYATGLVIYEMITGLPADAFPRLGERAPEIAADPALSHLNRVALQAAQRDHHRRFAHAGQMLAALDQTPTPGAKGLVARRKPARIALMAAGLTLVLALSGAIVIPTARDRLAGLISLGSSTPPAPPGLKEVESTVDVNFVTETHEAEIYVAGRLLRDEAGHPLRTPCTATGIAARPQEVRFVHPRGGEFNAGLVDFSVVREVAVNW